MTTDILDDLDLKVLPVIEGYNGEYVDEDFVLATFASAAEEIRQLRNRISQLTQNNTEKSD